MEESVQAAIYNKSSPMYWLYSALLGLTLLLTLPYWLLQMLRHGKYRAGLAQRLGNIPANLRTPAPRPTIWVHAVSVGEVIAVSGVVQQLQKHFPSHRVLVSTTTSTGQKLAVRGESQTPDALGVPSANPDKLAGSGIKQADRILSILRSR